MSVAFATPRAPLLAAALACVFACEPAKAKTICTLVTDEHDGRVLLEEGDCVTRVTPASTFKIPLAIMGFDAGILSDADNPSLPFRQGYPDWIAEWRRDATPSRWMEHSVLWYSQEIARGLGEQRFTDYVRRFGYGNADVSGDPGKANSLERSWVSSSLKISPLEQVAFMTRLYRRKLPVSQAALDQTHGIIGVWSAGGWTVRGKTGSAFPRKPDGSFDRARGWGWFVGWAQKDGRTLVFARLDQDEKRTPGAGGIRARDLFLKGLPALAKRLD